MDSSNLDVTQLQQGDVCLHRIWTIPTSAKIIKRSLRGFVLAEGEATGHAHVITDDVELYELNGQLYLKTTAAVTISHEEHRPVVVSPGIWQIERVREYDYFAEMERRVQD